MKNAIPKHLWKILNINRLALINGRSTALRKKELILVIIPTHLCHVKAGVGSRVVQAAGVLIILLC